MRDHGSLSLRIRAEEYRGAKHALKSGNESPLLRTALLHPEDVEHFGSTAERDGLFLLSHREGSEEDRNQAVLSPWNSVCGMAVTCNRNCPLRRSCSRAPFAGRLIGNPQRTNGREAKPRFWLTLSRLSRTN
ncbi:MAG: hypothetical protein ACR2JB_08165 [Bryobacteraceae bacterium]